MLRKPNLKVLVPAAFILVPVCLLAWWFLTMLLTWEFVAEASLGHIAKVRTFLNWGMNPNAVSQIGGITALRYAICGGHYDMVVMLLDRGADPSNGLGQAIQKNRLDIVELLIARGANVNAKSGYNSSPLQLAEGYGDKQIVQFLKSKGAVK